MKSKLGAAYFLRLRKGGRMQMSKMIENENGFVLGKGCSMEFPVRMERPYICDFCLMRKSFATYGH